MDFFGIGILEVFFILVLALVILGPDGMVKFARSVGAGIRKFLKSPIWALLVDTGREIQTLPKQIMRETGLDESMAELRQVQQSIQNPEGEQGSYPYVRPADWVEPSGYPEDENTIAPPRLEYDPPKQSDD